MSSQLRPHSMCFNATLPIPESDDESVDEARPNRPARQRLSRIFDRFSIHHSKDDAIVSEYSLEKSPQKPITSRIISHTPKRSSRIFSFVSSHSKLDITLSSPLQDDDAETRLSRSERIPETPRSESPVSSVKTSGSERLGHDIHFAAFEGRQNPPSTPRACFFPPSPSSPAMFTPRFSLGVNTAVDQDDDCRSPISTNTIFSSCVSHQESSNLSCETSVASDGHDKGACAADIAFLTLVVADISSAPLTAMRSIAESGDGIRESNTRESRASQAHVLLNKSLMFELDMDSTLLERTFLGDSSQGLPVSNKALGSSFESGSRFSLFNNTTDTFTLAPSLCLGTTTPTSSTLRVKAFCQDLIAAPDSKAKGVFAIIVTKKNVRSVAEFADAIARKVVSRYGSASADRVGLMIFFKGSELKPILLKQPGQLAGNDAVMLGIILDYIMSRDKLYIRTFL